MKTKQQGRYISGTVTEADIRAVVVDLIARESIHAVSRNSVAKALGVLGPSVSNELRMHFDDWLKQNFNGADRKLDKTGVAFSAVLPAAMAVADQYGLHEINVQNVADRMGINNALVYAHIATDKVLRRVIVAEAIATREYPRIVAACLLLKEPQALELDDESKRAAWSAAEAALFGIEDIPSKPERHTRPAAGASDE